PPSYSERPLPAAKLKNPRSPSSPTDLPRTVAPKACAQSSITYALGAQLLTSAVNAATSASAPPQCVAITHSVFDPSIGSRRARLRTTCVAADKGRAGVERAPRWAGARAISLHRVAAFAKAEQHDARDDEETAERLQRAEALTEPEHRHGGDGHELELRGREK